MEENRTPRNKLLYPHQTDFKETHFIIVNYLYKHRSVFRSVHVIVDIHRGQRHRIPGANITDTCVSPGLKIFFDKYVKNTLCGTFFCYNW